MFCEKDYKRICQGCFKVIALGRSELVAGKIYHARCVRCSACNESKIFIYIFIFIYIDLFIALFN